MRNFVQSGNYLDLTAPRDLASGEGFIIGSIFAIASHAVASGAEVPGCTEGVFDLPKKPAAIFAVGDKVSWDDATHQCDAPGTGLYPVGVALAAAGTGEGIVRVKLSEVPTSAAP